MKVYEVKYIKRPATILWTDKEIFVSESIGEVFNAAFRHVAETGDDIFSVAEIHPKVTVLK